MIISNCPAATIEKAASLAQVRAKIHTLSSYGLRHRVKLYPNNDKFIKVEAGEKIVYKVNAAMRGRLIVAFEALGFGMTPNAFIEATRRARLEGVSPFNAPEPVIAQGEKLARLILGEPRPRYKYIARYQRRSITNRDRACAALCWHGFKFFFIQLFALRPTARCRTAMANYNGSESFYDKYPATAERSIGSSYYPLQVTDACWCHELGEGE